MLGGAVELNWKRVSLIAGVTAVVIIAATFWMDSRQAHGLRPLREILWVEDAGGDLHPPGSKASNAMLSQLASTGTDVNKPEYIPMVLLKASAPDHLKDGSPVIVIGWSPPDP